MEAAHRDAPQGWRVVILILVAAALLLAGTVGAYLYLSSNKIQVTPLLANSRIPAGYSFAVLVRFKVGDVFGDGHEALVVNMPEPSKPFEWPTEESPGSFVTAVYRLRGRWLDQVYRSAPQRMPVSSLTLADTNGNGRQEIWYGYFGDPAQPAALEWEGTGFTPLAAWAGWPELPVVVGAVRGSPDRLLAFSGYRTPELAGELEVVSQAQGRWAPVQKPRPGERHSPKDHLAVADVNGDGRLELLSATSPLNLVVLPRPFTVTDLATGQPLLTLAGVFPHDVEVVDLNRNGIPEIYLSENLPLEVGKPYRGSVRGIEWDSARRQWKDVFYEEFDNARWVAGLASGDLDGDGRKELIIGTLRATDAKRFRLALDLRDYGGRPKIAPVRGWQ
jgi:hypothetical protein